MGTKIFFFEVTGEWPFSNPNGSSTSVPSRNTIRYQCLAFGTGWCYHPVLKGLWTFPSTSKVPEQRWPSTNGTNYSITTRSSSLQYFWGGPIDFFLVVKVSSMTYFSSFILVDAWQHFQYQGPHSWIWKHEWKHFVVIVFVTGYKSRKYVAQESRYISTSIFGLFLQNNTIGVAFVF